MDFLSFVFSFLYTRNWYSGKMELSRARLYVFTAGLFLILLGMVIVAFLQTPVSYSAT